MTAPKLKPCPFCASEHASVHSFGEDANYVMCSDCHAIGPPEPTQSDAIAAWNNRKEPKP